MSVEKAAEEARRWLATAEDDLHTARILFENKKFAQCCFFCQQAAEKAVKSLYYAVDADPWGHSVFKLLESRPDQFAGGGAFSTLIDDARRLDQYYIPTRYPNGLPGTLPSQTYSANDGSWAIDAATKIVTSVQQVLGS